MSALPHHHSPLSQRARHRHRFLHSLGRIFGIRIANGTPRDVTAINKTTRLPIDSQTPDDLAIYDLCKRIRHLIVTCNNHSIFTNKELWLKRVRGCVETVASLVICANIQPELFGDLNQLLGQFFIDGLDPTAVGSDGLFIARLEYLCVVIANREMASHQDRIKLDAFLAIDTLSRFGMKDNGEKISDDDALRNARRIDDYFETAKRFCFYELREALRPSEVGMTEERVREVLEHDYEANLSMLERIARAGDEVANIDQSLSRVNNDIRRLGLIRGVRGVHFDEFDHSGLVQPVHFFNPTEQPVFFPQFIFLHKRLRLLSSFSSKFRDVINRRGNGAYQEILEGLGALWGEFDKPGYKWSVVRRRHLMERQLWRLHDLRDGGGFGFFVELSFLAFRQLLNIPLSSDTHLSLILGTFGVITSNWRKHKHSIGTLRHS